MLLRALPSKASVVTVDRGGYSHDAIIREKCGHAFRAQRSCSRQGVHCAASAPSSASPPSASPLLGDWRLRAAVPQVQAKQGTGDADVAALARTELLWHEKYRRTVLA